MGRLFSFQLRPLLHANGESNWYGLDYLAE